MTKEMPIIEFMDDFFPSRLVVALPIRGHYDVAQYQALQYLQLHYGAYHDNELPPRNRKTV